MAIENPNSCGQGHDPLHSTTVLHPIIVSFGYIYSHSTPVVHPSGRVIHHTYKFGEHNVSVMDTPTPIWETSTSCASGRHWTGLGASELRAHLASKRRRYGLR